MPCRKRCVQSHGRVTYQTHSFLPWTHWGALQNQVQPAQTLFQNRHNQMSHWNRAVKAHLADWQLQDAELEYTISWDIMQKAAPYKCGTRRCNLCLTEKMVIATADPVSMLNKRAEIVSTCRHRAKFRFASSKACRSPPPWRTLYLVLCACLSFQPYIVRLEIV